MKVWLLIRKILKELGYDSTTSLDMVIYHIDNNRYIHLKIGDEKFIFDIKKFRKNNILIPIEEPEIPDDKDKKDKDKKDKDKKDKDKKDKDKKDKDKKDKDKKDKDKKDKQKQKSKSKN